MTIEQFRTKVKGKFFKACFVKQDGSLREMVARFGVTKHLRGGKAKTNDGILTVFDVTKGEYRSISIERLVYLRSKDNKVIGQNALKEVLK